MSDKHCVWENATSYSQSEDKTEIRTTQIRAGDLLIIVTKYRGYGDELVAHCPFLGLSKIQLGTQDMVKGQQKALRLVENHLLKLTCSLKAIQENQPS